MKCPQCEKNHQRKYGQVCGCGYHFALNPAEDNGWADGRFLGIIRRASANDTQYFTEEQLYTAYCHRLRGRGPLFWIVFILVIGGLGTGLGLATRGSKGWSSLSPLHFIALTMAFLLVVGIAFFIRTLTNGGRPPSRKRFGKLLAKWEQAQDPIPKLLRQPGLHTPPPEWIEPDIYDYGVERLLVVERPLLVDLLVRNGLHARERMLVISADGYPDYLLPRARRLLAEQPDLPVFLLHDATETGVLLFESNSVHDLLDPGAHRPIDLGLFPNDVPGLRGLRPIKPQSRANRVPVDALLSTALAALLTDCFAGAIPIHDAVAAHTSDGIDGVVGYG